LKLITIFRAPNNIILNLRTIL